MAVRTVVLDANVYLSALVFGGKPKRAFQLGITGRVHVTVSEPIRTRGSSARYAPSSAGPTNASLTLTA